jgi:predicted ester cyclase
MYMRAFPDIHLDIRRIACERDVICEEWRATGMHESDLMGLQPTHRKGTTLGCNVMEVGEDGLIRSETTYWDAAGLYRQLGALPELARAAGS